MQPLCFNQAWPQERLQPADARSQRRSELRVAARTPCVHAEEEVGGLSLERSRQRYCLMPSTPIGVASRAAASNGLQLETYKLQSERKAQRAAEKFQDCAAHTASV